MIPKAIGIYHHSIVKVTLVRSKIILLILVSYKFLRRMHNPPPKIIIDIEEKKNIHNIWSINNLITPKFFIPCARHMPKNPRIDCTEKCKVLSKFNKVARNITPPNAPKAIQTYKKIS